MVSTVPVHKIRGVQVIEGRTLSLVVSPKGLKSQVPIVVRDLDDLKRIWLACDEILEEHGRGPGAGEAVERARAEWEQQSQHQPVRRVAYTSSGGTPGVYALYQRGDLKYIGQSRHCSARISHHRYEDLGWLERKPAWKSGVEFTARVLATPGLQGGHASSEDERRRKQLEQHWISRLRPPCNQSGTQS